MPVELKNAPGLHAPRGYSHMSIAQGSRIMHFAGQIGVDADGALREGLAEQVEQAHLNLVVALEASGATPADLVKITWYVKNWSDGVSRSFSEGLRRATAAKPLPLVPMTIVGVQSLFRANIEAEVEAVAVMAG
ncbi:MAG: Rid family hydrolase [Micropepsaceae bacterium]